MPDNLQAQIKHLLATTEPAELGPGPRDGVRPVAELDAQLIPILRSVSDTSGQLIRALILLWHDHLQASHIISQSLETSDGSLVHAIMHRREPDFWNSKYWWRRVGQHPCFPEIARRVADLLKSKDRPDLAKKLVPRGEWNAPAFVDACQALAGVLPSDDRVQLLREIQKIETEVALEYFAGS